MASKGWRDKKSVFQKAMLFTLGLVSHIAFAYDSFTINPMNYFPLKLCGGTGRPAYYWRTGFGYNHFNTPLQADCQHIANPSTDLVQAHFEFKASNHDNSFTFSANNVGSLEGPFSDSATYTDPSQTNCIFWQQGQAPTMNPVDITFVNWQTTLTVNYYCGSAYKTFQVDPAIVQALPGVNFNDPKLNQIAVMSGGQRVDTLYIQNNQVNVPFVDIYNNDTLQYDCNQSGQNLCTNANIINPAQVDPNQTFFSFTPTILTEHLDPKAYVSPFFNSATLTAQVAVAGKVQRSYAWQGKGLTDANVQIPVFYQVMNATINGLCGTSGNCLTHRFITLTDAMQFGGVNLVTQSTNALYPTNHLTLYQDAKCQNLIAEAALPLTANTMLTNFIDTPDLPLYSSYQDAAKQFNGPCVSQGTLWQTLQTGVTFSPITITYDQSISQYKNCDGVINYFDPATHQWDRITSDKLLSPIELYNHPDGKIIQNADTAFTTIKSLPGRPMFIACNIYSGSTPPTNFDICPSGYDAEAPYIHNIHDGDYLSIHCSPTSLPLKLLDGVGHLKQIFNKLMYQIEVR